MDKGFFIPKDIMPLLEKLKEIPEIKEKIEKAESMEEIKNIIQENKKLFSVF